MPDSLRMWSVRVEYDDGDVYHDTVACVSAYGAAARVLKHTSVIRDIHESAHIVIDVTPAPGGDEWIAFADSVG